jgi:predicted NACHT family NTPase
VSDRSLKATEAGIKIAKDVLTTKKLTQEKLMELVDVQSRSTISNFFTGKPVDRQIFVTICEKLEINWQEISGQLPLQSGKGSESESINIEGLVKLARERCAEDIRKRCGTMRVLDMEQPIALSDIYTDVNILEKLTRNQRRDLDELMDLCRVEDFYRWGLGGIQQKRVEGIEAVRNHSKLMILGKPGAGKTTFLKFLAIACINGDVFADRVPIFVTLKDFADEQNQMRLFDHLVMVIASNRIAEEIKPNMPPLWINWESNKKASEHLVQCGKLLILLDGLDEVREKDDYWILKEIREFAQQYNQSQIVVTCRIAAKQYIFEQFTEVEVADFDQQQIATFAENWFRKKEIKIKDFLAELRKNNRVQELATSPLLLTLLCLAFEEAGSFPTNRAELYKEGLDALLRKWDSKRGIRRDSVYKDLSVQKKEDMLSQIALTTFENGDYFMKQRQLESYICDYIRNTANAKTDDQELHLDSEAVLKSIEAQHGLFVERARGIYSFSHLTFHEYFAARQILVSTSPSKLETALQNLVAHINDKRWREVILLSVEIAREADELLLLMKREIDGLLEGDEKLQSFLVWVEEKSRSVN